MTNEQHIENLKKLRSFHNGAYGESVNAAIKALEQRTGKWIYIGNGNNGLHQCNQCGAKRKMFDGLENYCPECGAKMVEQQERSDKE